MYNNVIRPIFAHEERGIATHDLKQPYTGMERFNRRLFGTDSVVWSHNGRYAIITNYDNWAIRGKSVELSLLDIWYGDEVILETFGQTIIKEGGAVTSACFTPDDSALYYTLYAHVEDSEKLIWLCQCNLDTLEIKRLQGSLVNEEKSDTYYPGLFMLDDGSLIALSQPIKSDLSRGVVRIMPDGERQLFRVPNDETYLNSRELLYSENSGWALALMNSATGIKVENKYLGDISALLAFQPETNIVEADLQLLLLRCRMSGETLQLFCEPLDLAVLGEFTDITAARNWYQSVLYITSLCLSPDGYYALASVRGREIEYMLMEAGLISNISNGSYLVMIDLEKSEARIVTPLGFDEIDMPLSMEWNGDTVVYQHRKGFKTLHIQ